jgi:transposase
LSNWEAVSTREMDWTGLKLLLEGIEPRRVRLRYKNTALASQNMNTNTDP